MSTQSDPINPLEQSLSFLTIIGLLVGTVVIGFLCGFFYFFSEAFQGGYYNVFLVALFMGASLFALMWLTRCKSFGATLVVVLVTIVLTFALGHYMAYLDQVDFAASFLRNKHPEELGPEPAALSPEVIHARFVKFVTGTETPGFWGYLAAVTTMGYEEHKGVRVRTSGTDIWVWVSYVVHVIFFLGFGFVGAGAAIGAQLPDPDAKNIGSKQL